MFILFLWEVSGNDVSICNMGMFMIRDVVVGYELYGVGFGWVGGSIALGKSGEIVCVGMLPYVMSGDGE